MVERVDGSVRAGRPELPQGVRGVPTDGCGAVLQRTDERGHRVDAELHQRRRQAGAVLGVPAGERTDEVGYDDRVVGLRGGAVGTCGDGVHRVGDEGHDHVGVVEPAELAQGVQGLQARQPARAAERLEHVRQRRVTEPQRGPGQRLPHLDVPLDAEPLDDRCRRRLVAGLAELERGPQAHVAVGVAEQVDGEVEGRRPGVLGHGDHLHRRP